MMKKNKIENGWVPSEPMNSADHIDWSKAQREVTFPNLKPSSFVEIKPKFRSRRTFPFSISLLSLPPELLKKIKAISRIQNAA